MIDNIKASKTLKEMIYATETVAYYFGLSPTEFWEGEYGEISTYIQSNMIKVLDNLRMEITVQEAVTDKLIKADSLSKKPKIIPLRKTFEKLFKQEPKIKVQSLDEQVRRLRSMK